MTEHDETRAATTPAQPYTIYGDTDAPSAPDATPAAHVTGPPTPQRRGGPDPITLVAGIVSLVIAVLALTGQLEAINPRWVLALGALAVGGTLLLVTLRRRRA